MSPGQLVWLLPASVGRVSQNQCAATDACITFASEVNMLHTQLPRVFIGKSCYLHIHDMLLNLVQLCFSAPEQA